MTDVEWNRDAARKPSPMDETIQELTRMTDEVSQVMSELRQKLDPIISPQMEDRVGVAKELHPEPVRPSSFVINRLQNIITDLRKARHLGRVMLDELEI